MRADTCGSAQLQIEAGHDAGPERSLPVGRQCVALVMWTHVLRSTALPAAAVVSIRIGGPALALAAAACGSAAGSVASANGALGTDPSPLALRPPPPGAYGGGAIAAQQSRASILPAFFLSLDAL